MKANKLLVFVNIVLIGLVLWLGTDIVMGWMPRTQGGPAAPSEKEGKEVRHPSGRAVMKSVRDYYYIMTNDVFDTAKKTGQSAPPAEKVPVTQLPLRLKGTVVGKDRESYAVIQEGNAGKEKLCAINDTVQRARIVKIASDHVVLDVNGKMEALNIFYEKRPASTPTRVPKRRPRAPRSVRKKTLTKQAPPGNRIPQPSQVFKPTSGQ